MATVKGVNKTKCDTPTAANRLGGGLAGGRVRVMYDTYETSATAAGTIIEMGDELPVGAKILDVILSSDNLTNNTTLKVGDYEDDDRYVDAVDHGAAELTTRMNDNTGNIDGFGYEVDMTTASTPDNQIIITTGVGAATGTIKLVVLYTAD